MTSTRPDLNQLFFVDNETELQQWCERWQQTTVLALDTEFIRVNTFYPLPALLQVFDGENCVLIDLPAINNLSSLAGIMQAPSIVKVFHACGEDLEIMEQLFQCLPQPLFDTQIAAAMLGYGFSMGYARLVQAVLNETITMDESRSDWLQRPLTENQKHYAALDVIYLYELYQQQQAALQNTDKQNWFQACCEEQLNNFWENQRPENYFARFKNAWRLSLEQQELLSRLSLWREQKARSADKPRNHVIKDHSLYGMAQKKPADKPALKQIEEMHPKAVELYGDELLAVIHAEESNTNSVFEPVPYPLPKPTADLGKQLKRFVMKTAETHNIAPEMLARKKHYEDFIRSGFETGQFELPAALQGWRRTLIGEKFIQLGQQWFKYQQAQ